MFGLSIFILQDRSLLNTRRQRTWSGHLCLGAPLAIGPTPNKDKARNSFTNQSNARTFGSPWEIFSPIKLSKYLDYGASWTEISYYRTKKLRRIWSHWNIRILNITYSALLNNGKQTKNCSLLIHPRVNLVLEPVLCAFLSRLINQRMNKFALSSVYFTLTRGISLWARVRISTVRWF